MNTLNINVTISATPEVIAALHTLISIMVPNAGAMPAQVHPAPAALPEAPPPITPPVIPPAPPQQYAPPPAAPTTQQYNPPGAPTAPPTQQQYVQQTIPGAVPTTGAPTYTLDQLSVAATPLLDNGRAHELSALLQSFGVTALTQLPQEQYGAFATALRGLGAQI